MNITKEIQRINEREAALGLKASWHDEYANSPYVFVGNLDHGLTEGDIVAVFEQYVLLLAARSAVSSSVHLFLFRFNFEPTLDLMNDEWPDMGECAT
jgi:hypothetical protein